MNATNRSRRIGNIVAAILVAPWTFVGVLWLASMVARQSGKPLPEVPHFGAIAVAVVTFAFIAAVGAAVLVLRSGGTRNRKA